MMWNVDETKMLWCQEGAKADEENVRLFLDISDNCFMFHIFYNAYTREKI